jgi:hypothetical protein
MPQLDFFIYPAIIIQSIFGIFILFLIYPTIFVFCQYIDKKISTTNSNLYIILVVTYFYTTTGTAYCVGEKEGGKVIFTIIQKFSEVTNTPLQKHCSIAATRCLTESCENLYKCNLGVGYCESFLLGHFTTNSTYTRSICHSENRQIVSTPRLDGDITKKQDLALQYKPKILNSLELSKSKACEKSENFENIINVVREQYYKEFNGQNNEPKE